jgi:hypothetical protein
MTIFLLNNNDIYTPNDVFFRKESPATKAAGRQKKQFVLGIFNPPFLASVSQTTHACPPVIWAG